MGDTRFKNGLALGSYNNFYATTAGVFAQADTTPDVTDGVLFYSNNTSNTTITHFDLTVVGGGAGSNAGAFEGKVIKVIFLDNSTGLANTGNLKLATSDNLQGKNNWRKGLQKSKLLKHLIYVINTGYAIWHISLLVCLVRLKKQF